MVAGHLRFLMFDVVPRVFGVFDVNQLVVGWNHCASSKWSLFMLFFFSWQDAKKYYQLPASNSVGNSERMYMELVSLSIHLLICVHICLCIHMYLKILTYLYTFHSFHSNPILFQRFKKRLPIPSISITDLTPLSGLEHPCWGFSAWFVPRPWKTTLVDPDPVVVCCGNSPVFWRWNGRFVPYRVFIFCVCVCSLK